MKSVLQAERECFFCKTIRDLHLHHVYGGPKRKRSDAYGYVVYLCAMHHNTSNEGVHFNREMDLILKELGQKHFEAVHGSREQFIKIWGRSYF